MDFAQRFERVLGGEVQGNIVCGNCLEVMAGMPDGCVNLVYIDPPFGDNAVDKQFGLYWNATEEYLQWLDEYFGRCVQNIRKRRQLAHYLYFMHERLVLMYDLLAEDGSIYVHCDWRVSSYIRLILEEVFGASNLQEEIIWRRSRSKLKATSSKLLTVNDYIFHYAKNDSNKIYNLIYWPYSEEYKQRFSLEDENGRYYWAPIGTYSQERYNRLKDMGRLRHTSGRMPRIKNYLHEGKGVPPDNVWIDIDAINSQALQGTGYATQKPEALLERIIRASSNEGDLVADFFCGSGTTLAVAAKLGRRYFGCDTNPEAVGLALERLARDREQRTQMELGI